MVTLTDQQSRNIDLSWQVCEEMRPFLNSYPLTGYFEITNRCNANCVMCTRNFSDFRYGDMNLSVLENCKTFLPYLTSSILTGWGEPLVHPQFREFISIFADLPLPHLSFQTNGRLLDDDLAEFLVRSGAVKHVSLSIDGAHTSTFSSIRKGISIDHVIKAALRLKYVKYRYHSEHPTIGFEFVAMRRNIRELPALVDLAAELGVNVVYVVYLTVHHESLWRESLIHEKETAKEIFQSVKEKCKAYGLRLELPHLFGAPPRAHFSGHDCLCPDPWTTIYISWDGAVRPCCFSSQVMGNITRQSFHDIWNGSIYQNLRSEIRNARLSGDCGRCHSPHVQSANAEHIHQKIPADTALPRISYY